jgi:hypothetical protein
MGRKTLVMYEISQKQNYIFRTNRLIENIGASMIIRQLTEEPHQLFKEVNIQLPNAEEKIVGGGNAVFIFDQEEDARKFTKLLTSGVLRFFPGIEIFLVTKNIDWENDILYDKKNEQGQLVDKGVLSQMRDALADKKNKRTQAVQQLSWGIHLICSDSGLPASALGFDKDVKMKVPRARELVLKEKMGRETRDIIFEEQLLEDLNKQINSGTFSFLDQKKLESVFYQPKSDQVKSYVAIVHIDGNAMGTKVGHFLKQRFGSNNNYINQYKAFVKEIDDAYKQAFKKMVHHLMNDYDRWASVIYGTEDASKDENLKRTVPLRPIVAAGDDICFITYGQLGIECARLFIQYLQEQNEKQSFEACAGIAIVKHKFPFWLAYELSEQLCSNAKKRLKTDSENWGKLGMGMKEKPYDTSLIDWHLVKDGDFQFDIDLMRRSLHENEDGSYLLQRPYYLQRQTDKIRHHASYQFSFLNAMNVIVNSEMENPRSKWKALLDVYHQGVGAVEQWKIQQQFDIGPNQLFLAPKDGFSVYGTEDDKKEKLVAYYYDALEVMDYFIPLSEVKEG